MKQCLVVAVEPDLMELQLLIVMDKTLTNCKFVLEYEVYGKRFEKTSFNEIYRGVIFYMFELFRTFSSSSS